MTPNGARRPLTRGASRPLPRWQVDKPLRRPAVASTSAGPWPLPHWAGRETAGLTVPHRRPLGPPPAPCSVCRPATLQPPPRPHACPPGPQPAQLPRPLTLGLTLTEAARLSQSAASQGEPQALLGFSANHMHPTARLRPREPVSG